MSIEEVRASNSSLDDFFSEIEHDFSVYNNPKFDEFLNLLPDDYAPADNLNVLINGIQYYIKSIRENISKFYDATKDSANEYKEVENNEYNKSKTELPDGSSIDISNNSSSPNNYYDDYNDYNDYSDSMINHDSWRNRNDNKINDVVIDDIILEKLAPFGINKSNIGEVISSDEYDYVITINGTDTNQNGLSKIYIKNGNVVGGIDLNSNYVSIDNENLILDNNDSSTIDEAGVIGGGLVAGSAINKSDTSISLDNIFVNPDVATNIDGNSINTIDDISGESKDNNSDITNDKDTSGEKYAGNNIYSNSDNFDSFVSDDSSSNYTENSLKNSSMIDNNQENALFNNDDFSENNISNNFDDNFKIDIADNDDLIESNTSFE